MAPDTLATTSVAVAVAVVAASEAVDVAEPTVVVVSAAGAFAVVTDAANATARETLARRRPRLDRDLLPTEPCAFKTTLATYWT
jgi:hypothetical protein